MTLESNLEEWEVLWENTKCKIANEPHQHGVQLGVWLVLLCSQSKEETRLTYLTHTSMKLGILFLIEVRYVIWRVEKWARDQFVLLLFELKFVLWVDFMLLFRLKFSVLVWKINSWVWGAKDYMLGGQEEFFWPNYKISGKYVDRKSVV